MANGTWKISVGGTPFADYTDILQPEGNQGGPNIQKFMGYGAASPTYINLGNAEIVRPFTMTRTHATDTLAHSWYQTAAATWNQVATVILTHIDYSGTETTFTITGAKFEVDVATPIGPTTTTKIKISGGASS